MTDVIVVGAGIVGAACAWRLATAGLEVMVFDPDHPGEQASLAALGVLSFHARPESPTGLHRFAAASRDLYPPFLEQLANVTGERVPFQRTGNLMVALNEADLAELESAEHLSREWGFSVERLEPAACRDLEPDLSPAVRGGLLFSEDAWVDNTALTPALRRAAQAAGAMFRPGRVERIDPGDNQVRGVQADGRFYPAEWVVLAAGCWSGAISGVPPLPVEPRRGQGLAVAGSLVRHIVSTRRVYLVPRANGETLVGATVERAGFEVANTVGGLQQIMRAGEEVLPRLADNRFVRA